MFDVREHIVKVIRDSGMKQGVIAERMGLKPQQLSDIVHKRRKMEANEFLAFCMVTGITPLQFYTRATKDSEGK